MNKKINNLEPGIWHKQQNSYKQINRNIISRKDSNARVIKLNCDKITLTYKYEPQNLAGNQTSLYKIINFSLKDTFSKQILHNIMEINNLDQSISNIKIAQNSDVFFSLNALKIHKDTNLSSPDIAYNAFFQQHDDNGDYFWFFDKSSFKNTYLTKKSTDNFLQSNTANTSDDSPKINLHSLITQGVLRIFYTLQNTEYKYKSHAYKLQKNSGQEIKDFNQPAIQNSQELYASILFKRFI